MHYAYTARELRYSPGCASPEARSAEDLAGDRACIGRATGRSETKLAARLASPAAPGTKQPADAPLAWFGKPRAAQAERPRRGRVAPDRCRLTNHSNEVREE